MKREILILIAAILMGIATAVFYNLQVTSIKEEMRSELKDKIAVCAVSRSLGARQRIDEAIVVKKEVPRAFLHPQAVKWESRTEIRGQAVLHPMQASQVVLWSDLQERSRRSVDDSIPPGRAVVTIPIDMVGGVSGLISPGSRVDVVGIFRRMDFKSADEKAERKLRQQAQSLEDLNNMLSSMSVLRDQLGASKRSDFYIVPVANNLGVFAVGAATQAGKGQQGGKDGYSTISFDVPEKTRILLIMAMHKVETEGGRLVCVLRSSQTATAGTEKPGEVYRSDAFLELVPKAYSELQESR